MWQQATKLKRSILFFFSQTRFPSQQSASSKLFIITVFLDCCRFPEQKSEKTHLKKGKYYYMEAYQKADKLADCVSVAVELPSGHFEGPIKRVHLSWRLPGTVYSDHAQHPGVFISSHSRFTLFKFSWQMERQAQVPRPSRKVRDCFLMCQIFLQK